MKHNVNYLLLGVVLAILVSMIGLIILYYVNLQGLRSQYNSALSDLQTAGIQINKTQTELLARENQLAEKERILLDYLGELNISKQRETSISEHFLNEKEKAEALETNLGSTQEERDRYANLYNKYYEESQLYQKRYTEAKTDLDNSQNKLARAKGDATEINNMLEDMTAELSALASELDKIKSKSDTIQAKTNNNTIAQGLASDVEGYAVNSKTGVSALNGYAARIKSLIASIRGS